MLENKINRIIFICTTIILAVLAKLYPGKFFLLDYNINIGVHSVSELFYGKDIPIFGGFVPLYMILVKIDIESYQRILLLTILTMSGYSMYIFTYNIILSRTVAFYAGILYTINPYTYIRMIVNHWHILLSYAILPLLLKYFIDVLNKNEKKEIIKFILLLSIVAFNIHVMVISFIIMSVIFLFWFNKQRDIRISKVFILSALLFILLNSYWVVPVIIAKDMIVDNIGEKDLEAFSPKGGLFDIASLYGFWRDGYLYTKDFLPGWQIFSLIIISLAIIGFIFYYKDPKIGFLIKALGVIWIIGFILASGVNGPFGDIVRWLFENTILKGFRDSHKFVVMMVVSYAALGGLGVKKIKNICDNIDNEN